MSLLRDEAIRLAQSMLVEIPFNNIYSYADNLFDTAEMNAGDIRLNEQVRFLKNTDLSQVVFENTDNPSTFILKNRDTLESIPVSNRSSSRNEIRGEVLRSILEQEKVKKTNKSLFNTISEAVKDPKYSDSIVMMKGCLTSDTAKQLYDGESMSIRHFSAFQQMVLYSINSKITSGEIESNISPKEIRHNDNLKQNITSGINFGALYDLSHLISSNIDFVKDNKVLIPIIIKFNDYIYELDEKASNLEGRGCINESKITKDLATNLRDQQLSLIHGDINPQKFVSNTNTLIQEAKKSELGNLRGVGKVFFPIFNGILNILTSVCTLGLANLATGKFSIFSKQTDTINQVDKLENELDNVNNLITVN